MEAVLLLPPAIVSKEHGGNIDLIFSKTTRILEFYINGSRLLSEGTIALNDWSYVVATYESGVGKKIYIDGKLDNSGSSTGVIDSNTRDLIIGNKPNAARPFGGYIDEVLILNRTLSADEVSSLFLQRNEVEDSYVYQKDVRVDTSGNVSIPNGELTTTLSATSILSDGVTGTTQSASDNSTKIATTAYVESAVSVENLWDRSGTTLSPSTANDSLNSITDIDIAGSLSQPVYVDEAGLVMDIPFEQYGVAVDQYDNSPYGLVASNFAGSAVINATNGKYGSGIAFAVNEAMYFGATSPSHFPTGASDRTVEYWVKPTSVSSGRAIVFGYGTNAGNSYFASGLQNDQAHLAFFGNNNYSGTTDFVINEWHHVIATYDGTTARMYVNNDLKLTVVFALITGLADVAVISGYGGNLEGIIGNVAHLKMYNRVLSEEERRAHYLRHGGDSVIKSDSFRIVNTNNQQLMNITPDGWVSPNGNALFVVDDTSMSFLYNTSEFEVSDTLFQYSYNSVNRIVSDTSASRINSPDASNQIILTNSDAIINSDLFKVVGSDTNINLEVTPGGLVNPNVDRSLYQPVYGDNISLIASLDFEQFGTDELQYSKGLYDNTLTSSGGVITQATGGAQNDSTVIFDGIDGVLKNTNINGFDMNASQLLTVECWAKSVDIVSGHYMWVIHGSDGSNFESFILQPTGSNQVGVYFGDGTDASQHELLATVDDVTAWHLYTVTLDRVTDTLKVYVDGALKNTGDISGEPLLYTTPIKLGLGAFAHGDAFWEGSLSRFRIYGKVLSEDEVRTHYLRNGGNSTIKADALRVVTTDNTEIFKVIPSSLQYNDGTRERLRIDGSEIQLNSANGASTFEFDNTELHVILGGVTRFDMNASTSDFYSPNAASSYKATNTEAEIITPSFVVNDGAVDRLTIGASGLDIVDIATLNRLQINGTHSYK